jgi:hypothetical protein
MSREFNLRYNEIQPDRNANDNTTPEHSECVTYYETEGHARNVCFVLENGDRIFLNYAYLVSGEYEQETGKIKLSFTTHNIVIEGNNLILLFENFAKHMPIILGCSTSRYKALTTDNSIQVLRINAYTKD